MVVPAVAAEIGASEVHVTSEVTEYGRARDIRVAKEVRLVGHDGLFVHPPGSIRTSAGDIYKVFTPFHRAWAALPPPPSVVDPDNEVMSHPGLGLPSSDPVDGGEGCALNRLSEFAERADEYDRYRDRPDLDSTSRISVAVKYGWLSAAHAARTIGVSSTGRRTWTRQLAWRDFYGHHMAADPTITRKSIRAEPARWLDDPAGAEAWGRGSTGYPLVDAGMRQLKAQGWIHNRVRLVTASFLVKDLLIDWRIGERHFRRYLLDADPSQNAGNWQWVAGTGHDAAPFFRIFNPVTQSRRFDPAGDYIRRWVPELAGLSGAHIHAPWEAGPLDLAAAGVTLGFDYPEPIVDHDMARIRALEAYGVAGGSL
jgi:deoxyribodipyrimidine photo-lyase